MALLSPASQYPGHFDINLYEGVDRETGLSMPDVPKNGLIARLLKPDKSHRECDRIPTRDPASHPSLPARWSEGCSLLRIPPDSHLSQGSAA